MDLFLKFQVENKGAARTGTVRIFYAPKYDERGEQYLFKDQKGLFVELDRFTFNCKYQDSNLVMQDYANNKQDILSLETLEVKLL